MGRAPCCDKAKVKKGPWSPEEDATLKNYIEKHGTGGNWIALPHKVGLRRCGKSCRLRWLNYLRPNIKHGEFSEDEDTVICTLFATIGSRWSIIAAQLPGRTDNDIKNYWNTKLKKKLMMMSNMSALSPHLHQRRPPHNNNQITTFSPNQYSSFLQNSSSSSMGSSYSSLFNNNNSQLPVYHHHHHHHIHNPIFSSSSDGFVGHLQGNNNYYNKDSKKDNLINFGGDQPSCSSSDGSCITNQVKEVETDYRLLQSFLSDGVDENDDQKFMIGSSNEDDGCFVGDRNPLDRSIEEIKQLISTNHNMCSSNSLNFFLDDQIKIEDKILLDY